MGALLLAIILVVLPALASIVMAVTTLLYDHDLLAVVAVSVPSAMPTFVPTTMHAMVVMTALDNYFLGFGIRR
jgi:hypothetical protein